MIHPMMRTRMTTTKRMKRTRKKKRKKMTIGHGGGAEDRGMIEKAKSERPRISRKEAERVSIPAWPKIHQLDNWKMQLLMNVGTGSWVKPRPKSAERLRRRQIRYDRF